MLSRLDPNSEVPDEIYLASLEHAAATQEVTFREVLVFHRDCLNGGLDQALFNRANGEEELDPVISSYRSVGLPAFASLLDEASILWKSEADLDELVERYVQMTYGESNDQPDAVEGAAVRYAQLHAPAFASIIAAAERGDFTKFKFDFGGGG